MLQVQSDPGVTLVLEPPGSPTLRSVFWCDQLQNEGRALALVGHGYHASVTYSNTGPVHCQFGMEELWTTNGTYSRRTADLPELRSGWSVGLKDEKRHSFSHLNTHGQKGIPLCSPMFSWYQRFFPLTAAWPPLNRHQHQ